MRLCRAQALASRSQQWIAEALQQVIDLGQQRGGSWATGMGVSCARIPGHGPFSLVMAGVGFEPT
jgi:hypothetical protein